MAKTLSKIIMVVAMLLCTTAISLAHGGVRANVWIGPGWGPGWGPWWGVPYPYYPPQTYIIERPPVEYIQPSNQQQEEPAYWYYCKNPEGYYPYVKRCPDGWMKVIPTPPPNSNKEK